MKTLAYLLEAYFHQDWDADHNAPEEVIRHFCTHEPPSIRATLLDEVDALLAKDAPTFETSVASLQVHRLCCTEELTRQWLCRLRERLVIFM